MEGAVTRKARVAYKEKEGTLGEHKHSGSVLME